MGMNYTRVSQRDDGPVVPSVTGVASAPPHRHAEADPDEAEPDQDVEPAQGLHERQVGARDVVHDDPEQPEIEIPTVANVVK